MRPDSYIGTRDDPHAQARHARGLPLLLHSMSVFREIFGLVFAGRDISTVVEVGVESGRVSGIYAELGASTVYCVDPHPTEELRANLSDNDALHLVEKASPAALAELPLADLYVLDGDHNYAVVYEEISWIQQHAPDAVIVLHDVLWPCSRRDLYYEPSQLSPSDRHSATDDGPTVWHDNPTPAGFVGLGVFTAACHAGGERNGVLTAVEDAISNAPERWHLELVPAVFGMGVLVRQSAPGSAHLIERLRPYSESQLLAIMENNRIALYTRVLQMQHEAVAHADDADRLAEAISGQRHEIERLRAELAAAAARHASEVETLRHEKRELQQLLNGRLRPRIAATLTHVGKAAASQLRSKGLYR